MNFHSSLCFIFSDDFMEIRIYEKQQKENYFKVWHYTIIKCLHSLYLLSSVNTGINLDNNLCCAIGF